MKHSTIRALLFEYMNYFDKEANELLGTYGDGQNSIDSRLAKLPPEARQYLHSIFMDMIDKYPRH